MHKHPMLSLIFVTLFTAFLITGCGDTPSSSTPPTPMEKLDIPNSFEYRTTELYEVDYDFGETFAHIPIAIYGSVYDEFSPDQPIDDFVIGTGTTDADGLLSIEVALPLSSNHIVLKPNYIGLPDEIRLEVGVFDRSASRVLASRKGDTKYKFGSKNLPTRKLEERVQLEDEYWWFVDDDYSDDGIPESLYSFSLEKEFLKELNNSIFRWNKTEGDAPQILKEGLAVGTLDMSAGNNVWLSFLDERSSFNNTVGFYTYPTDKKPATITVKDITLVFPNASHGGKKYLKSGDFVYIGKIPKGHSLGFVLIANGWSSPKGDNDGQVRKVGQGIYYSEKERNPDGQHHASIMHYENEVFLLGMEDNTKVTDYNFNDVVFAIIVGDKTLVTNSVPSHTETSVFDSDGDGVMDALDAYPNDNSRTTVETVTGTLAYEDQWPLLGDYDFNDLVVGYKYAIDGNAKNEIVSIEMQYTLLASGAGFPNGLALALPVKKDAMTISDVTYSIATNPYGVTLKEISEGSQVLIFKRQDSVMGVGGSNPFNTGDNTKLKPEWVSFTLEFKSPISRKELGSAPYDLFMLVDNAESDTKPEKSGREVHLIGFKPTSLANDSFLEKAKELGNIDYYKSKRNLPWALHIPGTWDYPLERKSIVDAYTRFGAWAESGGEKYRDWYLEPKYRDDKNIYDPSITY